MGIPFSSRVIVRAIQCALLAVPVVSQAQIQFSDVTRSAGMGNITATYGAAWADVNNDGWPDLFANNHARRNSIYLNDGTGKFKDAGRQLDALGYWDGDGAWEDTHGGTWADVDNDGDQDLMVTTGICCNPQFYENVNGLLYYRSEEFGFGDDPDKGGRQAIWFDMDKDGLLEVMLTSFYPAALMAQDSRGVFQKAHRGLGFLCTANQFGVMADLDADGTLEILCIDKGGPFVQAAYDITTKPFTDVTNTLPPITGANDVILGDFDGNLRTDMFLVRGSLRPAEVEVFNGTHIEAQFVNNDRAFRFETGGVLSVTMDWNKTFDQYTNVHIGANGYHPDGEVFTLNPSNSATHGMKPYKAKDYSELYIGYDPSKQQWEFKQYAGGKFIYSYFQIDSSANIRNLQTDGIQGIDKPLEPALLSNLPSGFKDVTQAAGLGGRIACISGVAGDFDNDMDLDLYVACRGGVQNLENRLYENRGNGTFVQVAAAGGARGVVGSAVADQAGTSDSAVMADYDLDGRLDVVVTNGLNMRPHHINGGPDQLFKNTTPNAGNWVQLDLVGTASNRDAVGAKVYATTGGVTQLREQNGGHHRWSQNHQRIHFGLAGNAQVNLKVEWPNGAVEQFNNVNANKIYRVTEGGGIKVASFSGTGGGTPDPTPTPDPVPNVGTDCGMPSFDASVDRAVFVWKDCNADRWSVRVMGGGSFTRFQGEISADQAFSAVDKVSLESTDVLDNGTNRKIGFDLRTSKSWDDGFEFSLGCNAVMSFKLTKPNGMAVLVGKSRASVAGTFDPSDYLCGP